MLTSIVMSGLKASNHLPKIPTTPLQKQQWQLMRLLMKAMYTQFGKKYKFKRIVQRAWYRPQELFTEFAVYVPLHTYEQINSEWWSQQRQGKSNITWPGGIKYYALSSGTSDATSKYIPLSKECLLSNKRAGVKVLKSLSNYPIPKNCLGKDILILGGSTNLNKENGYHSGDLSGIQSSLMPLWFQPWVKPNSVITEMKDWNEKMEAIVEEAPNWDVSFIVGVPSWFRLLFIKIMDRYQLNNIHEMWPNLEVFVHGGVAIDTYKSSINAMLGRPIQYIETYLASEGFLAMQLHPSDEGMRLQLNNGIFYEFIPFNSNNFDSDGNPLKNAEVYTIDKVMVGVEYAIVITTNAGIWRYILGDTIEFLNTTHYELKITGRIKHSISLCGEHTSIDNFNAVINTIKENFKVELPEYTVLGKSDENVLYHHWYLACDTPLNELELTNHIDVQMCHLNDDYATERKSVLQKNKLTILPTSIFYQWMENRGKLGAQNKMPRVLKSTIAQDWEQFVQSSK
ncbi:MAG: GH3 auxin-responsive promoter family protein [Cytophagaceae bacterium]